MSTSYDETLPTARDRMRQLLGDTDVDEEENVLIPDETYEARLTQHGETLATAILAESLATLYAQQPGTVTVNGKTVAWADRVRTWLEIAKRLRAASANEAAAAGSQASVVSTVRPGEETRGEYRRPEDWPYSWVAREY